MTDVLINMADAFNIYLIDGDCDDHQSWRDNFGATIAW